MVLLLMLFYSATSNACVALVAYVILVAEGSVVFEDKMERDNEGIAKTKSVVSTLWPLFVRLLFPYQTWEPRMNLSLASVSMLFLIRTKKHLAETFTRRETRLSEA